MATRPKAIDVLEVEVRGFHIVGNPDLMEDGDKGIVHEAMAKMETHRTGDKT